MEWALQLEVMTAEEGASMTWAEAEGGQYDGIFQGLTVRGQTALQAKNHSTQWKCLGVWFTA